MTARARLAPLALLSLVACAPGPDAARGPRADGLMRQMQACIADPSENPPCAMVEPASGFAVIKDDSPEKPLAWLIVPTDPEVTGIESPATLVGPVAGFWATGWRAGQTLVPAPPERLGLAINSEAGRTQNLLHIHISCLSPQARAAIDAAPVGRGWAAAPFLELAGQTWNARRVAGLAPESPFVLLRELPGAAEDPGLWSLAVVAAEGGGFILLADSTRPGVPGDAEALLDETCATEKEN